MDALPAKEFQAVVGRHYALAISSEVQEAPWQLLQSMLVLTETGLMENFSKF